MSESYKIMCKWCVQANHLFTDLADERKDKEKDEINVPIALSAFRDGKKKEKTRVSCMCYK